MRWRLLELDDIGHLLLRQVGDRNNAVLAIGPQAALARQDGLDEVHYACDQLICPRMSLHVAGDDLHAAASRVDCHEVGPHLILHIIYARGLEESEVHADQASGVGNLVRVKLCCLHRFLDDAGGWCVSV